MAQGPRIPFSGVLLVVLGGLFLADQMGVLSFQHLFRVWWPAIMVLAGLLNLIEKPSTPLGPLVLITVGVALLLSNLGYVQFSSVWKLWPLVLIGLGLNILFTQGGKGKG